MTCNGNCDGCVHSKRKVIYRCGLSTYPTRNITCNGNCEYCQYNNIHTVQFICTLKSRTRRNYD